MRLTLEKMRIVNFKGIRDLSIDFNDGTTHIAGMNGSGKSTLPDAFCWVLFNKDSKGNAPGSDAFREKPLDDKGQEIHNLDTTVDLICKLDGKALELKRTQRENWVKKRGYATASYTGNTSTYWINGVESTLKDFKAKISAIASDDIFRLIGSLSAFNAQDWRKRREQLLSLAGSDIDNNLLATDKYRPLADQCNERNISIDDLKKVLNDQRKRTNEELRMLPVRIDEAKNALPNISDRTLSDAEYIVEDNAKDIEKINQWIAEQRANTGKGGAAKIAELEQESARRTKAIMDAWTDGHWKVIERVREAKDAMNRITNLCTEAQNRREIIAARLATAKESRDKLRAQYIEKKKEAFVPPETQTVCPVCGQHIPQEKTQETIEKARDAFEANKASELEFISKKGAATAQEVTSCEDSLNKVDDELKTIAEKMDAASIELDNAMKAEEAYPIEPDFTQDKTIDEIRDQIAKLRESEKDPDETIAGYERRKAELQESLEKHRAIIVRAQAGEETKKRIAALEDQQRETGIRMAELEKLIELTEQYVMDRCAALEESINEKFPTVRWKLFDTQTNGGIVDTCNALLDCPNGRVPYETANKGAQMRADVEIVDVLSSHYGVRVPLFVDNAESCNYLPRTDTQTITLTVSTDSELTVKEA